VGNCRSEDSGQINVRRREAEPGDRAEQLGFRERYQGLRDPGSNRQRPATGRRRRQRDFVAPADTCARTPGGREVFHRRAGISPAEQSDEQARRVDAIRKRQRSRRDPEDYQCRPRVVLTGQSAEIAQSARGDRLAQHAQLADQIDPQPVRLRRILFRHTKQERLTAVGEGSMLDRGVVIVQFKGQRKDSVGYVGSQHPIPDGHVWHHVRWVFASLSSSRHTFGPPGVVRGISPRAALACQSLLSRVSCMYRFVPRTPRSSILPKIRRNSSVKMSAKAK
jgi:hypothetical protein